MKDKRKITTQLNVWHGRMIILRPGWQLGDLMLKKEKKKRGTVEHMSQNEPTENHRNNSFNWRIHFGTGEVGCANEQTRFKNKYFRGERMVEIPN